MNWPLGVCTRCGFSPVLHDAGEAVICGGCLIADGAAATIEEEVSMSDSTPTLELPAEIVRDFEADQLWLVREGFNRGYRAALDASGNDELVEALTALKALLPETCGASISAEAKARMNARAILAKHRAAIARTQEQSDG